MYNRYRMNTVGQKLRLGWLFIGVALLLRGAIPAGYMPASSGTGLLFELCPENVPVEFMQLLAGHDGDSGEHSHHVNQDHEDHHCPLGHLLLSAFAVDDYSPLDATPVTPEFTIIPEYMAAIAARTAYLSRGPPA